MKKIDTRIQRTFLKKLRHNLRNPMNSVLGFSELLIEESEKLGIKSIFNQLAEIQSSGYDIIKFIDKIFSDEKIGTQNSLIINEIIHDLEVEIKIYLGSIINEIKKLKKHNIDKIEGYDEYVSIMFQSCEFLNNKVDILISSKHNDIVSLDFALGDNANLSIISDTIKSIEPLGKNDKKTAITGTILVVDDNENNIKLLNKRLNNRGHTVLPALDGRKALSIIRKRKTDIDLILLDIIMPDMNGYELLKYIKSDRRYCHIPVIMVSSLDDIDSIYRCFEYGADDYVKKPYESTILNARINSNIEKKQLHDREEIHLRTIQDEKEKSESLLLNILPESIAERLKLGETKIADKLDNVTILFADIVGFTKITKALSPSDLVDLLNQIFMKFDELCDYYGMEKIKTIGDSYMAASGIPEPSSSHAIQAMGMATAMLKYINSVKISHSKKLNIRIGMHCGSLVAGIIGKKKFVYDLWGDTVNIASRLESSGEPGKINISKQMMKKIKGNYQFERRGMKEYKGIGKLETYLVLID